MNNKPLTKKKVINLLNKCNKIDLKTEYIKLIDADNRFLAKPITSLINVPPFNNSAVDGYALHDKDVGKTHIFKISSRIAAGDDKKFMLNRGQVARIFTGAKMPLSSSTVVMQENVVAKNNCITIIKHPRLGENCRLAGEDVAKSKKIFKTGTKINSQNISLLAAVGKSKVQVKKKLRIGYFTSGNELFNPSENLSGSKINNSNQYALHALLNKPYLDANYLGVLKDSKDKILNLLIKYVRNYSVIITTGGASVGEEDHLIDLIKENGELFFWKTAIKPGRPLAVGIIKNAIIICLPGNPVSVYLLYGMLIKSFLEKLCGSKIIMPIHYSATVNFSMKKKTERLEWLRVNIDSKYNNKIFVNKYPKQGSGMISSIAYSDGIIEIPEDVSQISKGDQFKLYLFSDIFD